MADGTIILTSNCDAERKLLAHLLAASGFSTAEAHHPAQVTGLLDAHTPAVIVIVPLHSTDLSPACSSA